MKLSTYIWSIIALTFVWLRAAHAAGPEISALTKPQAVKAYGQLPLSFEANQGQTDQRVKFLVRGHGYSLFLTTNEAVLALKKKEALPAALLPTSASLKDKFVLSQQVRTPDPESRTGVALGMRLIGANPHARVTGLEELPGKSNYFIGNDPKKWRTNVPNYAKVKYTNVYPGVDLVYYGNQGQLEYDFVVQPGADPSRIVLNVGAGLALPERAPQPVPLHVDRNGDLSVGTEGGEVIFRKPLVYQPEESRRSYLVNHQLLRTADKGQLTKDGGEKHYLDGRYVLRSDNSIAFQLAPYDRRRPVIIDPTLAYSTYLGGNSADFSLGIAVDATGDAYVTGSTFSSDFPTSASAFQVTLSGVQDAFVSKLNGAGSALLYSTYLGGSDDSGSGTAIAVDASGNAYITGLTRSSNFPTTPGALQTTSGGDADAFVTKLNATGSALLYSTYLGGSDRDFGFGIALDAFSDAYVCGFTFSSNFPTTMGALQTTLGGATDAFVSKLNAAGSALVYSTYLGGSGGDECNGIAADASDNAYVTGQTFSSNFPSTPGALQTSLRGNTDAFIAKLNVDGSALVYSTYLGGSADDASNSIAVDPLGNAYVTGGTGSSDFPTTPGAFQTTFVTGGGAFLSKLNAVGSALVYSTYLLPSYGGTGLALDASGNSYVIGSAGPGYPTTSDAFQTTYGGNSDAFFSKLNASGSNLLYSTYLGGNDQDSGLSIAVDATRNAYVTGYTNSSNFPITPGTFQTTFAGGNFDAFASKFSFGIPFSSFSGKLELDPDAGSFELNAGFTLGVGSSIDPPTQPVRLTIGTYSVTIPAGSFVRHHGGYRFEGVINGVRLEVLIKHRRCDEDNDDSDVQPPQDNDCVKCACKANSYKFLAEGRGANLKGTTNPVTVTLSIGNDTGTTEIHAEFE